MPTGLRTRALTVLSPWVGHADRETGQGSAWWAGGRPCLRAGISARLGKRVNVEDVVAEDGSGIVWVHIRRPPMSEQDLLALQEWVQTELWLLAAEQSEDGLIIAPRYV